MSTPEPGVGRWAHFRAVLSRQARGRSKDTIAIALLAAVGIVMTLWIFTQQKATLPSWVPLVGEEFAHVTGEFTTAQAVTPGQGQAVDIAGIQVGKVTSVDLEKGHAVVGMDIEPKYMELIHPDATLLLRPKTNLNDMVVEVDPGKARGHIEDGYNFPLSRTEPNVNLDAFLATLDADTRQYIQLLVAGGAQGIGDRGRQLSGALRRLQPFSHYIADLNRAVARRREALARVIHNFGLLTTELGRHDRDLERFVSSSSAALGDFANQQEAIQETLVELPSTLAVAESAFASADRFAKTARPALLDLIPQAQALGPALRANARFFEETTEPIAEQVRPFTRQIRPTLTHVKQGAADLEKSVRGFGNALGGFNSFLNELAYKPKGSRQSYLFYLPWLNHNINATFNLDDPAGPISRSLIMISCNGTDLAYGLAGGKPFLQTLLQGANIPRKDQLPPVAEDPTLPGRSCGPESK
ncbi:MAG TPA: MlaD family protein [Solirubrobacterales bacterium]|nr:MlaD family protein [Solirubrobacterales bacterium]